MDGKGGIRAGKKKQDIMISIYNVGRAREGLGYA